MKIEGGSFNRLNDSSYPATVSDFRLDLFEVTVGRMRAFADAYPASLPEQGAGALSGHPETGWNGGPGLPADASELRQFLGYNGAVEMAPYVAWTSAPGPHENMPIAVVTWHLAQAFCIWDGGRLPTEAEWNYASAGGNEQRKYPWGSVPPDATRATLDYSEPDADFPYLLIEVGSAPAGAGRWGHLDFNGSRTEWLLDANLAPAPEISELPVPCVDCATISDIPDSRRIARDLPATAYAQPPMYMPPAANETRESVFEWNQVDVTLGMRCVYGGAEL